MLTFKYQPIRLKVKQWQSNYEVTVTSSLYYDIMNYLKPAYV